MSTMAPKGSGSERRSGGVVVAGGTLGSDSPMTKVLNTKDLATGTQYGSKVVSNDGTGGRFSDQAGVKTATGSGTLAYNPSAGTNYIVLQAGDNAAKINGTTTTVLTVPGADYDGSPRDMIHKVVKTYKYGSYSTASFNVLAQAGSGMVPGRTKGSGAGSSANFVQMNGSTAATDDAATPTRAVPGELTYMFGSVRPYSTGYKAKSSYES
jgi:hypothetical protein